MLVLTRKTEEKIIVKDTSTGETVGVVQVVEITRGRTRIGFDFSRRYSIQREEVA